MLFHSNRTPCEEEEIFNDLPDTRACISYASSGEDYTVQTYYVMQEIPHDFSPGPYQYSTNPFAHEATTTWAHQEHRRKKKQTQLEHS
jgi:hypothetical protein